MKLKKRKKKKKEVDYQDGAEGFIKWCEENVRVPITPHEESYSTWCYLGQLPDDPHPDTGRSFKDMWEAQKKVFRQALKMKNGKFVYRLIVFCWPRGDGKSLDAVLIQLWKFFCFPKQQIMLGANSRDQIKFVHYEIMKDIILNSPKLLAAVGGVKNIQEKEIRMKNRKGQVVSIIRSVSSFTGIFSNITGYTFSEMFDMKNPKFFTQLDGSIRNIPNALGVIDSTVSRKDHILYKLYRGHRDKKIPSLYFSYRFSKEGDPEDYWHPLMTKGQLQDYKEKFIFGDFERYFLNLWEAGHEKIFTSDLIEATNIIGVDGHLGWHTKVLDLLKKKEKIYQHQEELEGRGVNVEDLEVSIFEQTQRINKRFRYITDIYNLGRTPGSPVMASIEDLANLGQMFDTDWSIIAGIDRGDPMKRTTIARTIVTILAKGLVGSKSNPLMFSDKEEAAPQYIYFLLHLAHIESQMLEDIKSVLDLAYQEFDGIDSLCGERYGIWDMKQWCEERDILFEAVYPSYGLQKEIFRELYLLYRQGRFKTPPIVVPGTKLEDILKEEADAFDHDLDRKWFGSPEKGQMYGAQDDCMFALAWGIYGGRTFSVDDFRERKGAHFFGQFIPEPGLIGKY